MSVAASAIMLGSTFGIAAAATYPEPFVTSGTADGAVVVGANAAASDWAAAIDLSQSLNNLATTGGTVSASVTGEAAPLFTTGTKLYVNDTLNLVKSSLVDDNLPIVLKDGTFSGNVDATYTQSIAPGDQPRTVYGKLPSSSDDPTYGLAFSSTTGKILYNATVTLNKAVNFSHADSEGQDITMFGQKFTVAAATDGDTLVLLKEAMKVNLDSTTNPSQEVTVAGKTYTVELVSASDTSANIKVTDSAGASDNKEINEAASKKVQGLTIAVQTADETNLKLSASIIAGAEKITIESGSAVTKGEDDTVIDGATAYVGGSVAAATSLTLSIIAPNSDKDAMKTGESFTDPVFGSFKIDFAGLNIKDTDTAREDIVIANSGDDRLAVKFQPYYGTEAKNIQYVKNWTVAGAKLQYDDNANNITVFERENLTKSSYVVVGNEDSGKLIKVTAITNQTTGYSSDKVSFQDVFTGESKDASITADGTGSINYGGKDYTVNYGGTTSDDGNWVRLRYPDGSKSDNTIAVIYPTIQTSKGAKLFFYEPITIQIDSWDEAAPKVNNTLTALKIPDGDGYATITLAKDTADGASQNYTLSNQGTGTLSTGLGKNYSYGTAGRLVYNLTSTGTINQTKVYLTSPVDGSLILDPAVVIFEEKDDNTAYEALIVTIEQGGTSDDGIGVSDVLRTWNKDATESAFSTTLWEQTMYSDSKKTKEGDLWGSIILLDASDSDQQKATISYPDEQLYAQIYVAANAAEITAASVGGTTAGGKTVVVKDSEASSVSASNLIVVGGSCINTLAATILGSETPLCGADFSAKTNVAAGQYLIKVVASPLNAEKIAMLVAGYDAADTTTAAAKVKEGVATDKDTETVYPIATA